MSLILGKCLEPAMKQTYKVLIPKMKLDNYLTMYFRESEQILVHDPKEQCKPGDWILVRELTERLSLKVNHKLEKVVYKSGDIVDPISGQKSLGYTSANSVEHQAKMFGLEPLLKRKL